MITITFDYMNHNGKLSGRTVDVDSLEFLTKVGLGYQPGWFISGYCHTKKARRSFALSHIVVEADGDIIKKRLLYFNLKDPKND